jgi:outer membrane protein
MKNKFIIVLALILGGITTAHAQQLKIAHINTQELLATLPESDSAQAKIQKSAMEWQETLEEMQVEFNTKYQDYLQNSAAMSEIKKRAKETELQDLDTRIKNTNQTAEQDLQGLRQQLLQPIIEKTTKAIEEVGRENGFTYILDTSEGSVVIFAADNAVDIMDKVKAKLSTK